MKNLKAFTLAETLIALVIIGVIAALTVPVLIQRTQKQEYVSALKKMHSTLSQAVQMIIAEEGSPKGEGGWASSDKNLYEHLIKNLNVIKACGKEEDCFGCYEHLGGLPAVSCKNYKDSGVVYYYNFVLADGTAVLIRQTDSSCINNDPVHALNHCAVIYTDINGKKGPNITGRDVFSFAIKENGLFPAGCDTGAVCSTTGWYSGYGCTCKVLQEGAMNY